MHGGAQRPDHGNIDREPSAIDARIEGVAGDDGVIAILGGPDDLAHDGRRLDHVMQAVQTALRPHRVEDFRAGEILRKADLDPCARRSIGVGQLLDGFDIIGGAAGGRAGRLIQQQNAHGRSFSHP